jgi:hypothetical protein
MFRLNRSRHTAEHTKRKDKRWKIHRINTQIVKGWILRI